VSATAVGVRAGGRHLSACPGSETPVCACECGFTSPLTSKNAGNGKSVPPFSETAFVGDEAFVVRIRRFADGAHRCGWTAQRSGRSGRDPGGAGRAGARLRRAIRALRAAIRAVRSAIRLAGASGGVRYGASHSNDFRGRVIDTIRARSGDAWTGDPAPWAALVALRIRRRVGQTPWRPSTPLRGPASAGFTAPFI
jgi:hypothetical protein